MTEEMMKIALNKISEIKTINQAIKELRMQTLCIHNCIDNVIANNTIFELERNEENKKAKDRAENDIMMHEIILDAAQEKLIKLIKTTYKS